MLVSSACLAIAAFLLVLMLLLVVVEGGEQIELSGYLVRLGGGCPSAALPFVTGAFPQVARLGCVLRYTVGTVWVRVSSRGSASGQHRATVAARNAGYSSQLSTRFPVCSRNPRGSRCRSCQVFPPMGIGHNAGIPETVIPSPARCTRHPTPTA